MVCRDANHILLYLARTKQKNMKQITKKSFHWSYISLLFQLLLVRIECSKHIFLLLFQISKNWTNRILLKKNSHLIITWNSENKSNLKPDSFNYSRINSRPHNLDFFKSKFILGQITTQDNVIKMTQYLKLSSDAIYRD